MDLPVVKAKIFEGLFENPLLVGIVCIVVMLLSKSSEAFLQSRCRARVPLALGLTGLPRRARSRTALGCRARWHATSPFLFLCIFNLVSKVNL